MIHIFPPIVQVYLLLSDCSLCVNAQDSLVVRMLTASCKVVGSIPNGDILELVKWLNPPAPPQHTHLLHLFLNKFTASCFRYEHLLNDWIEIELKKSYFYKTDWQSGKHWAGCKCHCDSYMRRDVHDYKHYKQSHTMYYHHVLVLYPHLESRVRAATLCLFSCVAS